MQKLIMTLNAPIVKNIEKSKKVFICPKFFLLINMK